MVLPFVSALLLCLHRLDSSIAREGNSVLQAMTKVCPCRDTIARLAENGMKNTAISSKLGVPLRTVQKIVKQWREKEHVQPRAGSGRKRTVNTRRMRGII
ncbi:hypothetical protein ANCCEY_13544, partial [Ancylostoma ceylanicum]